MPTIIVTAAGNTAEKSTAGKHGGTTTTVTTTSAVTKETTATKENTSHHHRISRVSRRSLRKSVGSEKSILFSSVIADTAGTTTSAQLTREMGYSTITTTNLVNETTTNHLQPTPQNHHTSITRVSRRSSISIRKSMEEDVAATPITTTPTKLNDIILLSNNNELTYGVGTPPALRGTPAATAGGAERDKNYSNQNSKTKLSSESASSKELKKKVLRDRLKDNDKVKNQATKNIRRLFKSSTLCCCATITGLLVAGLIGAVAAVITLARPAAASTMTTTIAPTLTITTNTTIAPTLTITANTTTTTGSTSPATAATTTSSTITITTSTTSTTTIRTTTTSTTTTSTTSTTLTSTSTTSATTTTTCSPVFSNSNLVAYFPLDSSPSYLTDASASLTATANGVTVVAGERNQSLSFTGVIDSYFQVSGLTSLGTPNTPFSISLYINPNALAGTIVHISQLQSGTGAWCLPFIGFASTQQLAVQIWGGSTADYALGPIPPVNSWTHVVQTWSTSSGLNIYINGSLYGTNSGATAYGASGVDDFLTLASTLQAIPYPANGCSTTGVLGGLGYYNGYVDELRIYSRELTALEIIVVGADKGGKVVALDVEEYKTKIKAKLSTNTYEIVRSKPDPAKKIHEELSELVKSLKKVKAISNRQGKIFLKQKQLPM
ncbi:unnamed protein product, partial [Didymodactylos carnosus]